ncbi:hypothetical protein Pmani_020233 [Petrolisthes manimaculis]|uniref:Uncharacterized protein n=1 Tax=Petrolisthes manimaculis TaxID=1843537 RepID=A0AAE1U2S6_9EUCA|nr:hypothetical protein Pmani_020233 [Petrolisthes manimaculis]
MMMSEPTDRGVTDVRTYSNQPTNLGHMQLPGPRSVTPLRPSLIHPSTPSPCSILTQTPPPTSSPRHINNPSSLPLLSLL